MSTSTWCCMDMLKGGTFALCLPGAFSKAKGLEHGLSQAGISCQFICGALITRCFPACSGGAEGKVFSERPAGIKQFPDIVQMMHYQSSCIQEHVCLTTSYALGRILRGFFISYRHRSSRSVYSLSTTEHSLEALLSSFGSTHN